MKTPYLKAFIGISAFLLLVCMADPAAAQGRRRSRVRVVTKAEVDRVIKRVETQLDRFVGEYDRSLDRSRLDGTDREDWLNKRARDLESATDELRREFDRRDSWGENRAEVRRCLNIATDINKNVRSLRLGPVTEGNWARLRAEFNSLAAVYGLPAIGSERYK
ncbi:MAG: hypothetical protein UZ17_ACD001001287 [Acidobacteria bacterium OLB17]|nr:MAG: hypothetical protein UZ17_ACD001001287 [Acidobacteria bacterium OLB17]MCZ2391686.1 hypothetical protein [Acidobacteriota bacterium]